MTAARSPLRYVAAIGGPEVLEFDAALRRASPGWRLLFKADGVRLAAPPGAGDPPAAIVIGAAGAALGAIFPKSRGRRNGGTVFGEPGFGPREAAMIARSGGDALIEYCWGRYIAFLADAARRRYCILRDPSGMAPCYFRAASSGIIAFSDLAAWVALFPDIRLRVDGARLARRLSAIDLGDGETALAGVDELLPGERLVFAEGRARRELAFDPASIAADTIEDDAAATRALRAATQSALCRWAEHYPALILSLSGGLDSSIVLAGLSRAARRPQIACFNYHATDRESDERVYARLAAAYHGAALHEASLAEAPSETWFPSARWLSAPLAAQPTGLIFGMEIDECRVAVAQRFGASAFFSGEGGDHVFFRGAPLAVAADHLRRFGAGGDFKLLLREGARRSGLSVARAAVDAAALALGGSRRRARPLAAARFVRPDRLRDAWRTAPTPLWRRALDRLSPGKAAHAEGICLVATRPPAFGLAAWGDVINPLLSQEIVETCLRTPVYLLSAGGVDRALARRAFRHMLPPEILGRRSKGGTSGYFVRSCRANFAALEPYMLEGTLVRCDFVDRRALERLFTPESLECADNLFPLFLAITAEAWLRRIENHSPR